MASRDSKTMHLGGKSGGGILEPNSKIIIFKAVWHLDLLCRLFQEALLKSTQVSMVLH